MHKHTACAVILVPEMHKCSIQDVGPLCRMFYVRKPAFILFVAVDGTDGKDVKPLG